MYFSPSEGRTRNLHLFFLLGQIFQTLAKKSANEEKKTWRSGFPR
jgi:hypothetical protein